MPYRSVCLSASFTILLACPLLAQNAASTGERRTMTAERMTSEEVIELDGLLDEPSWQRAVPATDFIQQDPVLEHRQNARKFESFSIAIIYIWEFYALIPNPTRCSAIR